MASEHEPIQAPALGAPASSATVTVRVIDSTTTIRLDSGTFWEDKIEGLDSVDAPIFCFLISHGDRHVVFDLGVRRDWENLAPPILQLVKNITSVQTDKDVASILDGDESGLGIRTSDVEAIIWSHSHFDHTGDPSTFPSSAELVVGPGLKERHWPGYPTKPDAGILVSDVQDRHVREIEFRGGNRGMKIGRFDAVDFFGDGSFYLLDTPGHDTGNLCGLARVTSSPDSFVLMGGDTCHHAGILRPTKYLPLPAAIASSLPGDHSVVEPFLSVSEKMFPQYDAALETVRKIQELDASDNVLVILAHDKSLLGHIDLYPKAINDWYSKDVGSKTRWLFCEDFPKSNVGPQQRHVA